MFCRICGTQNPPGAPFCTGCGASLEPPPYQSSPPPPPSPAPAAGERSAPGSAPALASLWHRGIAAVLDTALVIALFLVAGMWTARKAGGITEMGFSLHGAPALAVMAVTLAGAFLYMWLAEALFGATIGKALMRVRVIRAGGGTCGFRASLVRNLLRLVDGIGFYLVGLTAALISKSRQRLGDMAADTVVVGTSTGAAARTVLAVLWVALIVGGSWSAYRLRRDFPTSPAETAVGASGEEPPGLSLRTTGKLSLVRFRFRESEDGPVRPPGPYKPAGTVFMSYDTVGYSTGDDGRPDLVFEVTAHDPGGLALHPPWEGGFSGLLKPGSPVDGSFKVNLPDYVPGGVCRLTIKVRDRIANEEAELTAPFVVEAPPVAPASELEVRDFHLSLSKDGPPADPPVLEGSGAIYMRCYVHGLQFRGDEIDMKMALRVIDPSGSTVLDKDDFLVLRESYAYHPPSFRVTVNAHVSLPSGVPKGEYREIYTLTDQIASRSLTREARFLVK